jgi:hypothetical protein
MLQRFKTWRHRKQLGYNRPKLPQPQPWRPHSPRPHLEVLMIYLLIGLLLISLLVTVTHLNHRARSTHESHSR